MRTRLLLLLLLMSLLQMPFSLATKDWSYKEVHKWGGTCGNHRRGEHHRQSPIDINSFVHFDTKPFVFKNYGLINTTEENNGHTLKILLHPGHLQKLQGGGEEEKGTEDLRPQVSGGGLPGTYLLDSFHFHWGSDSSKGSEHKLEGCAFAGEMHLVHYKKEYGSLTEALKHPQGLAVLGVWLSSSHADSPHSHLDAHLSASKANYYFMPGTVPMHGDCRYTKEEHELSSYHWYEKLIPCGNAESQTTQIPLHLRQMLPFDTERFYRYDGSLTTPPCTENVLWTLFDEPVSVPEDFLAGLRLLVTPEKDSKHHLSNNFRATQSISGRSVLYSGHTSKRSSTCTQSHDLHATCTDYPELHFVSYSVNEGIEETEEGKECCPAVDLPSPINLYLGEAEPSYSQGLTWKHLGHCKGVKVVNDGYVLKVLYPSTSPQWELFGSNLTAGYYLIGMQLRWGSEHHLGGLSFPLEIQLVHYNSKYKNVKEALKKTDGLVVVSKFFQTPVSVVSTLDQNYVTPEGHNKYLAGIIHAVKYYAHKPLGHLRVRSPDIPLLMGDTSTYYEYRGSLEDDSSTNGPFCSSSLATWMVIRKTGHISRAQMESLRKMTSADGTPITSNNRPVVSANYRQVILRISSRELTHEFEMMRRPKRSLRMSPLKSTTSGSSSLLNLSTTLIMIFLPCQVTFGLVF